MKEAPGSQTILGDANPLAHPTNTPLGGFASLFLKLPRMKALSKLILNRLDLHPQIFPVDLRAALAALPEEHEQLLREAEQVPLTWNPDSEESE